MWKGNDFVKRYRINQIKIGIDKKQDRKTIADKIEKKLGKGNLRVCDIEIMRKSIDARRKDNIQFVYTVDFSVENRKTGKPGKLEPNNKLSLDYAPNIKYKYPKPGEVKLKNKPLIVGFGPCGMFAALILAQCGYKPVVLERGDSIDRRVEKVESFWNGGKLDVNSNVQFGEGGAGTFSDGKLTTGISDKRIRKVLDEFVKAGADEDILYMKKPHIGTDVLRPVVKNIREEIIKLGGEIHFNHRVCDFSFEDGKVKAVKAEVYDELGNSKGFETFESENVILALGHSSRDTFEVLLDKGISMEQKPFSMGVRIEHPQDVIDIAQYGEEAVSKYKDVLPVADYKLSHHCENGRGVYTFCMCPGGEVVMAASEEGRAVTNGMSMRNRDSGVANSGLLVDVRTSDFGSNHPLAGVSFQRKYEALAYEAAGGNYRGPQATWKEFRDNEQRGEKVASALPEFVVESIKEAMPHLGRKLKGFDDDAALMTAVESRSSSPVRFPRNEFFEANVSGLYPAGEGTGHAGGIMSAACDGIKIAESIISRFSVKD